MKKTYNIEVDCANCALKAEQAAAKCAGVQEAAINFMTQKMTLVFEEGADPTAMLQQVRKACRKVEPDFEIEF